MEIISQQLSPDGTYLYTKYADGSISGEPITAEEASLWLARHGY